MLDAQLEKEKKQEEEKTGFQSRVSAQLRKLESDVDAKIKEADAKLN